MRSYTELVLFGSLKKEMADANDDSIRFELEEPTPLLEVLQIHNIPVNMVQLAMVNHRAVPKKSIIHPGDRLSVSQILSLSPAFKAVPDLKRIIQRAKKIPL